MRRLARAAAFEGATVPDKADSRDVRLGGRYPMPSGGRSFVKVLTTTQEALRATR